MAGKSLASTNTRRTVYLPPDVADGMAQLVREGKARNQNDLVVAAVRQMLARVSRESIDAEFARMAEDEAYRKEAMALCAEFAASDWEALAGSEQGVEKR